MKHTHTHRVRECHVQNISFPVRNLGYFSWESLLRLSCAKYYLLEFCKLHLTGGDRPFSHIGDTADFTVEVPKQNQFAIHSHCQEIPQQHCP